eukprot:Sdes_comp10448_c0_seq1m2143
MFQNFLKIKFWGREKNIPNWKKNIRNFCSKNLFVKFEGEEKKFPNSKEKLKEKYFALRKEEKISFESKFLSDFFCKKTDRKEKIPKSLLENETRKIIAAFEEKNYLHAKSRWKQLVHSNRHVFPNLTDEKILQHGFESKNPLFFLNLLHAIFSFSSKTTPQTLQKNSLNIIALLNESLTGDLQKDELLVPVISACFNEDTIQNHAHHFHINLYPILFQSFAAKGQIQTLLQIFAIFSHKKNILADFDLSTFLDS